jgi:hypothetical protein
MVKWKGHEAGSLLVLGMKFRMSGAVPLLPLYAFILGTDTVFNPVTSFFCLSECSDRLKSVL